MKHLKKFDESFLGVYITFGVISLINILNHMSVEYRETNKEKLNSLRKDYRSNKFKNDPIYKLSHNLRSLISNYIKKKGYVKNKNTEVILGCSFDEFKIHIESQFVEGMFWQNHGKWHLDHKKPISWAETEDQVYELNHYTNFQPLWAKDNLSKGNKWSD